MPNFAGEYIHALPERDKPVTRAGMMTCCHCGYFWVVKPGSGRKRGWCLNCNGPMCGHCGDDCIPREMRLENIEHGRPENWRPAFSRGVKIETDKPVK